MNITHLIPTVTDPFVLRWPADGIARLRLALAKSLNQGPPIDRAYDLPSYRVNGRAVTDQVEMRRYVIPTVAEHLETVAKKYPHERVIAHVGNGNLLANPHFVAYQDGQHYYVAGEQPCMGQYTGLVSWRDGRVTVEEVRFGRECGRGIVMTVCREEVRDITAEVDFVTTGQPLVRCAAPRRLGPMAELWYDIRHLLRPVVLQLNGAVLFWPMAQLQHGLARKALQEPVAVELEALVEAGLSVPLTLERWQRLAAEDPAGLTRAMQYLQGSARPDGGGQVTPAGVCQMAHLTQTCVDEALQQAGYQVVDTRAPLCEGQARYVNHHLEIHFQKAIYPHNMFVTWPDGMAGFVVFPGRSGREGVTLKHAQRFLVETLGVQDALLIDNGGDVQLGYRGRTLVGSGEGRAEIRSILALTAPAGAPWNTAVCLS